MIQVRKATLDDIRGIVEVYRSDKLIEPWYQYTGAEVVKAELTKLDVFQQFLNGGPWMNEVLCGIHVNNLLKAGQFPFVAEVAGQIVGNIELFGGIETGKHKLHIGVLQTHLNWRNQGVGRILIKKAKALAIVEKYDLITVWAADEAISFYEKNGFCPYLCFARIELKAMGSVAYEVGEVPVGIFAAGFPQLVLGIYQSSAHQWVVFQEKEFVLPDATLFQQKEILTSLTSKLTTIFMSLAKMPGTVEVIAWKEGELTCHDIELILTRAQDLGFEQVVLRLPMAELTKVEIPYRILGEHQILAFLIKGEEVNV